MPDRPPPPAWPRSMGDDLAAQYCGISPAYLRRLVDVGDAPKPFRLGKRALWHRGDLDDWLDAKAGRLAALPADDWQGALARDGAGGPALP